MEIIFFGAATLPPPPFPVTNAGLLNPWELAKLFASCDVGVVFSTTNPSFVPFEMMACRCAVVDLASERVVGLLEDGVNCRLAEPAPDSVAAAVLDLIWNQEQRAAIAETAYQQVKDKSWQHSARQIEEVLLRHSPAAQRVAYRAASGAAGSDDIDMLAWQIHQLLDAGDDNAALVDALRSALYRSLAEKAALVRHVQEVEQRLAATQQAAPGAPARAALQPIADRLLDSAPAWLLSSAPLSKLALDQEPLCQSFCADRSHLRRIELRLAPRTAVHTGSIRISLYAGDESGQLVTSELLRVAELPLDQPCAVEFAPQVDSYGKTYMLCVAAGELNRQPPAIWHFRQVQHAQARLRRGRGDGQVLSGQLAFQPFYGEHPPLLPPRQGPANWNEPIRLAPAVARALAERQGQEVKRLAGQARNELKQRGLGGLAREVLNYVQWQLSQRGQG